MVIDGLSAAGPAVQSGPAQAADARRDVVGYDAFLQLLIAQMRNQDPTKPLDSTQYVAQLATLSELEQSVKQTRVLEQVLSATSLGEAAGVIGRRLTSQDGAVSGIAVGARLTTEGLFATLENGSEIKLDQGVRIDRV
jgi:flagellar basal-body rod modification protein FlgD